MVVARRKAAVHCWSGIGRTNAIIGYYLVRARQLTEADVAHIARKCEGT